MLARYSNEICETNIIIYSFSADLLYGNVAQDALTTLSSIPVYFHLSNLYLYKLLFDPIESLINISNTRLNIFYGIKYLTEHC